MVTLIGAGLAIALFRNGTALVEQPAGPIVTAARNNLYADTFNEAVFEAPGRYLTRALVYLDGRGVDGLVNGLAAAVGGGSEPAAARPDRLRPVLRSVHPGRCAARGGGHVGGDIRMRASRT